MAGDAPAGAAISLRQTLASSKWVGQTCPKCDNALGEGEQVVLCPKCYTPQHAQCWQDNGNQCAVDQTPGRIIVRAGQAVQPAGGGAATPPASPAQLTPSRDADQAAQGRSGTPAAPPGAAQPEATAAAGAPPPPRAVPGAASGARPARPAAGAATREAVGLRPMATVRESLEEAFEGLSPEFGTAVDEISVTVPAERIQEAARRAKEHEDLRFDYLRCLSGVDYQGDGIEVVYHLFSTRLLQKCALKARVSGEGQSLPTVTPIWAGADWHEREAAEMFNIRFEGHPYPEPLLLQRDERGEVVPGPILLKRFPLRPKEPPGIYGFPEEE